MGYFANGTSGEMYYDEYCSRCLHESGERKCAVWFAHLIHNYKECNNDDSILHLLIPRYDNGLGNKQCAMFIEKEG